MTPRTPCARRHLGAFLAIVAMLALAAPARTPLSAQTAGADRFEPIRARIREAIARGEVPSMAVAVASHGRIVWEEGFGLADREHNVAATAQTPYSLASISKPFTASALMELVEAGRIDLDRPANDYLGAAKITGLAGDAAGATVRRILSHTAGLPLHYQFFYAGDPYRRINMDTAIARYAVLVNPPGFFEYSNLGFGIIDYIIERMSGEPYERYMQEHVFDPLGLSHTFVGTGAGHPEAAVRYDTLERPVPFYDFDHRGASALWASAHDLVRFGMFHLKDHLKDQRRILKDATLDEMHRLATPPDAELGYGLGWIVTPDYDGFLRVGHTGGMPGVSTVLSLFPKQDLAVVVLTNHGYKPIVTQVLDDIGETMLGAKYTEGRKAAAAKRAEAQKAAPPAPAASIVGSWVGTVRTYTGTVPLSLTVKPDGDVHVTLGKALPTLLSSTHFGKADLDGLFAGRIPIPDADRHDAVLLNLHLRGEKLAGEATAMSYELGAISSYVELSRK
ncbi:MAG TPA: serine hydrolase domain-containing protein [Longimicrobiales bacterium]